jgi:hypothetical protein
MVILLEELRRFINAARHIKDTRILPIYSYVKLELTKERAVFYKSNGHSFVVCPVKAEYKSPEVFIIEEKTLFGFVSFCSTESVTIKRDGKNITISDGIKSVSCQYIDDNYPAVQGKEDGDSFDLDSDVLEAIYSAKAHVLPANDKTYRPWNCFVHMTKVGKETAVAGFNGFTSYIQKFKQTLPSLIIDPDTVSIISKLRAAAYSSAGQYDLFDSAGITYGFIKPENKVADLNTVLENFGKATKSFIVNRRKLVNFCEMVLDINNSNLQPEISMDGAIEENAILLRYEGFTGQSAEELVYVEGKWEEVLKRAYNPKNILLTLKELGYDEVTVSMLGENLILSSTEEPNYLGSIMSLAMLNN